MDIRQKDRIYNIEKIEGPNVLKKKYKEQNHTRPIIGGSKLQLSLVSIYITPPIKITHNNLISYDIYNYNVPINSF